MKVQQPLRPWLMDVSSLILRYRNEIMESLPVFFIQPIKVN